MFIIDLESMKLYEISKNTKIFSAPKGILFWSKYQAIDAFKKYLKEFAERLCPALKGRNLFDLCIINGRIVNVDTRTPVELEGGELIEHYSRWIDFHRVIIWNNFNKDEKLKLTYIKM